MQEVSGSSPLSSAGQKRNSNESNSEYSRKVQQRPPVGRRTCIRIGRLPPLGLLAEHRIPGAVPALVSLSPGQIRGFGGQTVLPVQTRSIIWPGVNGVEPEPIACLEAARELERAAHALQLGYILQARQAGRNWYEIGEALDLHWAASANKESIVEAYDYAQQLDWRPGLGRQVLTWTCPACQQTIIDHGPYGDLPEQQEGHAAECRR